MTDSLISFNANDLLSGPAGAAPAPAPAAAAPQGAPSVSTFVSQYLPLAQHVSSLTHVAPEVLLGQWGLETGWGKSVIPGTNNLGNIKDLSGGGAKATDNQTGSTDAYRKYDNAQAFGDDFAGLINRKYAMALGAGGDASKYFGALKQGGYAEDPAYVQKGVAATNAVAQALGAPTSGSSHSSYYDAPQGDDYIGIKQPAPGPSKLDRAAGGFKRGFNQSLGLGAEAAALVKKTVTGDEAPDLMAYGQAKMAEGGGADAPPSVSFTDVLEGKGSLGDWIADSAGYLGYQVTEAVATGGTGGFVTKMLGKGAIEVVAKTAIEKEIGKLAASDAAKSMTREQIASQAASNVSQRIGAASAMFANNVRQESGSIYGDAVENQQKTGVAPDLKKVWLSSLAAAGVDTAADVSMAKGMLGMREGSSAATYVGRAAREVPKDMLKQGGTEYAQNEIETYGAGGDPLSGETLYSGLNDAAVGALGGVGGFASARHQHLPPAAAAAAVKAQEPNTPLSKAAVAGSTAQQSAIDATPPAPPAVDPISEKVAAIKAQVQSGGLLDALRSGDAPVDTKTFLNDLASAESPSTPAHAREQAMSRLEFTMGWAGQNVPAAVPSAPPEAAAAPAQGAATTPAMRQAGVDREAQLLAELQAATTPGAKDAIQREIEQNRQANLGTPAAAAPAAPAAAPVDFTGTDPGTALGAAPAQAAPTNTVEPPADKFEPALNTDSLSLAAGAPPAAAPAPAARHDTGDLSLVPKAPTPQEQQATGAAAAHARTNDASMTAQERAAQGNQAVADLGTQQDAADAVTRGAAKPGADAVIAALKPQAFQRTAEQKATIARAESTYQPQELQLLRAAAQSPFSLAAADKVRLGDLRATNPTAAGAGTLAERAAAAPTGATAVLRKRRAHLDQLAALGFDTVDRDGAKFTLRNSKSGDVIALEGPADAAMARAAIAAHIDTQAHAAAASPHNDLAEPSKAQIEAGNYKKGHIENLNGVKIAIENPRDSMRRGVSPDGVAWEAKLAHHYGDIVGTMGADGDPVDVFIGPRPDSTKIYVVDQRNQDGSFDEHKVMMGFTSEDAARAGYIANYDHGWTGLMAMTEMSPERFKAWVKSDAAKRPAYETSDNTVTVNDDGNDVTLPLMQDDQLAEEQESPARGGKTRRTTKAQAGLLRRLAAVFGKKIEFFTDPTGAINSDGFVRHEDPSTIYLNASSGISSMSVFGHELMHQVRAENPQAYDAIAAVVQGRVKDAAGFREFYGDPSMSDDAATEELIADLNGDLMHDGSFWREVFAKIQDENGAAARGIIARLAAKILDLLDRVSSAFKGDRQYGSAKFVDDSKDVRAAFRDGLAKYLADAGITRTAMQADVLRAQSAKAAPQASLKRADIADPESRTTVSTAQPTAKADRKTGYQPNSYTEDRVIDSADITASKDHVAQISAALRKYDTLSGKGNAKALMQELHQTVVDNLLWLHDHVRAEARERAKLWYDGAHRIATDWTKKFGINMRQSAGVLAVLSPQMDWFKNVSLAERVLSTLHERGGEHWTPGMTDWSNSWLAASKTVDEKNSRAADVAQMHRIAQEGKPLSAMPAADAAYFVRAFDEAYYPRSYRLVTPEGGFGNFVEKGDGDQASVTWGGFGTIEKAVSLYRDPSFKAVDAQLGGEHKVRNFYNNIVDPKSADGHVTIDTHAVAAGLMKPLSGTSDEVRHNLGGLGSTAATGASGSYGLYADAYRDAAHQRGILAREMQSITWEAIRALFPGELKKGMADKVKAVWARVRAGEITRDQARDEIATISKEAGGADTFAWEGGGAGSAVSDGATSFDGAVADDPAKRQVRTLDPSATKDKVSVSLSAATTSIPGIKALFEQAGKGDLMAHQLLQDIASDNLKHLLGGTSARVKAERATGLYAGVAEPSLAITVSFDEHDRDHVLAGLAKFADNFNQDQVHVRRGDGARRGTKFDDGSYMTPVYRWDLKEALSRKQIQSVIDKSGLYGLTFGDDFVEAYFVGDVANEQRIAEFYANAKIADGLLGRAGGSLQETRARLWPYGHGEGAIGYDRIRGELPAGQATSSVTARRVAEYLNREGDRAGKVKAFAQSAEITPEQSALQNRIADAYASLPDNDLKNPRVRKAYTALSNEVKRQYEALPVKVEIYTGDSEPYKSSADMRRDVLDNNHLFIFGTTPDTFGPEGVDFTGHPLLEQSGLKDANGKPLLMNDLLRAVHDYYAHTLSETQFGPKGEEAAWKNHMAVTNDPWARWALTSETRGQNSWVNFRSDLDPATPIKDRPFARQKAALLPMEHSFTGDRTVDKPMKQLMDTLPEKQHVGSKPEILKSRDRDLFPETFADKETTLDRDVVINSRGDKGVEKLGNMNSEGRQIAGSKQGLTNFWGWFGHSEAVDSDGSPLLMYHSTNGDFSKFEANRKTTNNYGFLGDHETQRAGIFMTPDREFSQEYLREGEGRNVMPVYLKTENPLDLRNGLTEEQEQRLDAAGVNTRWIHNIQNAWELFDSADDGTNDFVDGMRKAGYDGAIFFEQGQDEKRHVTYMALDPEQIKSATGNRGTFDAKSADITKSPARDSTFKPVLSTEELIDHIEEVSPHPINRAGALDAFKGESGVLTRVPVKRLQEGHYREDEAKSKAKEAAYAQMDPETMPPLIVDGRVVVEGNHRLRVARAMKLETVQAYVLHPTDSPEVAQARGITKSTARDGDEQPIPKDVQSFHKSLGDQIRAHVEYGKMLARRHEWAYNVGDQLLSTQTGRVYELTGRSFQRVGKLKDNRWEPVYSYETGKQDEEGWGRGTFREQAIKESKTLKNLTTPTMFSRARTDEGDDEPTPPAGGPGGGKPRAATTQRDAYRWQSKSVSPAGPEFYARNFALVHPTELEVDDFAEDDDRALPMGHAAFVDDANKPYHWDIVDKSGNRVGELAGQVDPAGNITAVHDIVSENKQRGLGRDVIATIAANHRGDVRIIEAVPAAQGFWDKVGAGYYDPNNNTTLDWDSVSRGLSSTDGEGQGEHATDSGGAIPTGEVGELSAEEADRLGLKFSSARESVEDDKAATAWGGPGASKFDDLVYKLQDKQIDTKRVVEAIKATDGAIKDDLDVYLQEELYHGRAAKRTEDFVHHELTPLIEEMKAQGVAVSELDDFLHARHAEEANAVIARRNPELQDGGSGLSNQDARAYFAELDPAKRAALEAAAAHIDGILRKTNELLVDYELESAETVHGWSEMFQHYIPLMREDEGRHSGGGTGQGFSIKGREVKSRTGSTRKVVDIMANVAMQRERTIVRGEKNRVARALVGLAQANPNKDFWQVDRVPSSQVFNKDKGIVEDRPDNLFKQRDNVLVAKIAHPGGIHEHAVVFNEKDERAVRMVSALKNLDAANLEGLLGASAKLTRYFAAVNTQYNPVFGVINLMRDVQESMVNLAATELAGQQKKVAKNTMAALRGIYGDLRAQRKGQTTGTEWAKLWEEFQELGGQTGYRQLFATSNDRAKNIEHTLNPTAWMDSKLGKIFTAGGALKVPLATAQKGAKWFFDWLGDYNEAMENGVRLSAYKAALDHGMTKERAASLAKNLTVNFNRKGQMSQQAGALYAFFNASVQGTARVGKTLFTMEPGKPKTLRLSSVGKKVVYGGMILGSMQAMALAAAGFRDDDPPQFARDNALIIPTGGKTYVSIPMPMGLRLLPALGRISTEFAIGGFKDPTKHLIQLMGLFADSFNPIGNAGMSMQTLAPTVFDPLVALTENKDFAGRPIAKTSMNKATPGYTLARDTSTSVGKVISEAINYLSGGTQYTAGVISPTPDQIDYLVGQVTGGVGRELSHIDETAAGTARGEDVPLYKMPLIGRLVGNAASQASEGSHFYDNLDDINKIDTAIKGMRKDGKTDQANQVRLSDPESYLITQAKHAELQVQKLSREKQDMVKKGATREEVKAQEQKITEVMARLNRAVESLKR